MAITQPLTSSSTSSSTTGSSSLNISSYNTSSLYQSATTSVGNDGSGSGGSVGGSTSSSGGLDSLSSYQTRNQTALHQRAQQLRRWREFLESENETQPPKTKTQTKVCFSSTTLFLSACAQNDLDECERLLSRKDLQDANGINVTDCDGLTALHQACIDDNEQLVRWLLSKKANINCKDNEGWTPLHASASCGHTNIVSILISHEDCDVLALNCDNELACDVCENKECETLIRARMNELLDRNDGRTSSTTSTSFAVNVSGDEDDETESKAFRDLRQQELKTIENDVATWIKASNTIDIKEKFEQTRDPLSGATILHVCAAKGYNDVLHQLLAAFEGQFDVDSFRDCDGYTALHAAAFWKQPETFETLLKFGANPELQTEKTSENIISSSVLELCKNDPKFVQLIEINKDEKIAKESETQRKIFAKRQREIRRSTQGVKKEDLEKALKMMEISQNRSESLDKDFDSIITKVNQSNNNELNNNNNDEVSDIHKSRSSSSNDTATAATPTTQSSSLSSSSTSSSSSFSSSSLLSNKTTTTTATITIPTPTIASTTAITTTSIPETTITTSTVASPALQLMAISKSDSETNCFTIKLPPRTTASSATKNSNNNVNNDSTTTTTRQTINSTTTTATATATTTTSSTSTTDSLDTPPTVTMTLSPSSGSGPAEYARRRRIKRRGTGIADEDGLIVPIDMLSNASTTTSNNSSTSNDSSSSSNAIVNINDAANSSSSKSNGNFNANKNNTTAATVAAANNINETVDASFDVILSNTNTTQPRSRIINRPLSAASSSTSLNSSRANSEDNYSVTSASSAQSLDGNSINSDSSSVGGPLYKSSTRGAREESTTDSSGRGSGSSIVSDNVLRDIQSGTGTGATASSDEIDYKKLCKQLLRENETLRRRIKELEEAEKKREQEFSREKRSMQRTISEQEEELKLLADTKADNVRLKDENAALIRVISKLSK